MSIADRLAIDYQPDFDIDREFGSQGELFTTRIAESLKAGSIEVKTDGRFEATGNLYIECACDKGRRGVLAPSGIATTKAELWVQVLQFSDGTQGALVLPCAVLRDICRILHKQDRIVGQARGQYPTKGYLLPLKSLDAYLRSRNVMKGETS